MAFVPRRARKVADPQNVFQENPLEPLQAFRDLSAWVLLGEPGSGKTTVFEEEAKENGGKFLRIKEFLFDHDDEWRNKTLFLDGLDEVRAGNGADSTLVQIRSKLRSLGNPPFRISCRAADWFGSTDREEIEGASPDGKFAVLLLQPLADEDIFTLLRENHGIAAPVVFVSNARKSGIADLLGNPQTLGMLANAVQGDAWPTRMETYQLACEKLAGEPNKRHRDHNRDQAESVEQLLAAAGQLCAVLLLSDKTGIALDREAASDSFPVLDDFAPPDSNAAARAIERKLFRPDGEERMIPSHRSIAEYLAARWLAGEIARRGLPLRRVTNLLLGRDGRTVSGLRGLYGWLALHSLEARLRLVEADPMTVLVYGDAKPMPPEDKRRILAGLRREAENRSAFRFDFSTLASFGTLADPELSEDFVAALESPARDIAAQVYVDCILKILAEGEAIPRLAAAVKKVILEEDRMGGVRTGALTAWLKLGIEPREACSLLDAIAADEVADPDDELAGILLFQLYPEHIAPEELLRYLHVPRNGNFIGRFAWFWTYGLPQRAPDSHLPFLLDALAGKNDLHFGRYDVLFNKMTGELLARGIALHGDAVSCERIFAWLGIGTDEYGYAYREDAERLKITDWIEANPDRYKSLLALCYRQCEGNDDPLPCLYVYKQRLHGAGIPEDLGLWHLDQAALPGNAELAKNHFAEAVTALWSGQGKSGLSLEKIMAWCDEHPQAKPWLEPMLFCEIPEWREKRHAQIKARNEQHLAQRKERSIHLSAHLEAIRSGSANAGILHELAGVWMGYFIEISGETPAARFRNYCEYGEEALAAAEAGFAHCIERTDLPSVAEIIDLSTKQHEHLIRLPCLVGMELRWGNGVTAIASLSDEILRRMLAFRLTYGAGSVPEWFTYLVTERPELVAEVLVDYASATFNSKLDFVDSIYPLENDPSYRAVAVLAVPKLLERFPLRARSNQLHNLEKLLKAALRYSMSELPAIAEKMISRKGIDVVQKVYWLATAMLLDPKKYEAELWRHIGKSWTRANHLSGFLSAKFPGVSSDYDLSAGTIARLIELLSPHAELEWPRGGGIVTETMQRGDLVRALVARLGALGTEDAALEIDRLNALPSLAKLQPALEDARHQLKMKQRENEFRFLAPAAVAQILAGKEPANNADLAAIALDHLDDIARNIRQDNDDGFRAFWNIVNKQPVGQREENLCRDALLTRLRARLISFGIDCQPEGDYFNDKRADIRLSFRNQFELPIEIKRDGNDSLWSALRKQLIEQYSIAPLARGFGIYLVLWFGGEGMPGAMDGGKRPRSPEELQSRLEAQLDPSERERIFVRVIDVSWPATSR